MLQSEFFERTKVNLTGEEYAKVEAIYNILPNMDKDEFCKEWLKLKDNPLIKEIAEGAVRVEREKLEAEQTSRECKQRLTNMEEAHEKEILKMGELHKQHMEDFAGKLIKACEYEDMPTAMYQEIEEEFGLPFIIRNKWKNSIELQDTEIQYMVDKLQ